MEYVTLNNGVKMPSLGYGVYQTPPADTESCVSSAIKLGYRSIDTAQAYGNEEGVGSRLRPAPRGAFYHHKNMENKRRLRKGKGIYRRFTEKAQKRLYRPAAYPPAVRRLLRQLPCNGGSI